MDYRIVRSLHEDSRRSFSDMADELGITPKTVHRRFERMVDHGVILRSLELQPESSNDIIAIFRLHLKEGAEVKQIYPRLLNKHSPNLLSISAFSDIQDTMLCTIWCRTMKDVRQVQRSLSKEVPIASVVLNMVHSTHVFDTWMDTVLIQMSKAPDTERARGKLGKGEPKRKAKLDISTISELETYRRALIQALDDGVITEDEEAILRSLRDTLKISESEHNAIFDAICSKRQKNLKQIETYRRALVQALEDGVITEDEEAILRSLRDTLRISDEDHDRLLRSMKGKKDKGSKRK
jgi:DNA-binding Lrp family transcriptional regulator